MKKKLGNIDYLLLLLPDINGDIKGRTLTKEYLKNNGPTMNLDSSSIPGLDSVENSDVKAVGDKTSFKILPKYLSQKNYKSKLIDKPYKIGLMFSYLYRSSDGSAHTLDFRRIARDYERSINSRHLTKRISGVNVLCGTEPEFYTFKKIKGHKFELVEDLGSSEQAQRYFDIGPGRDDTELYRLDVLKALNDLGIKASKSNHEVGPSQHEFEIAPDSMLKMADNTMLYKWITKDVARIHGWHASYIPKPRKGLAGNGMHIHLSIWDKKGKKNLMASNDKEYFSDFGKSFLAGVLHYAPVYSVIAAPTVNSYKRLVPRQEAPTIAVWDVANRSAMIRMPGYVKGKDSIRFELRFPDTSTNPYLLLPVVVEAGLQGVEKHMSLADPIGKDVYELTRFNKRKLDKMGLKQLPSNLGEAVKEARNDKDSIIRKALGRDAYEKILEIKSKEWCDYVKWCRKKGKRPHTKVVTRWELERYLYL